jgi:hypothetical protein
VVGNALRDQVLVGKYRGKKRPVVKMPQADYRDTSGCSGTAKTHVEATRDNAIAFPIREPSGVRIVHAPLGRVNQPVGMEAKIVANPSEYLAAIDLGGLHD